MKSFHFFSVFLVLLVLLYVSYQTLAADRLVQLSSKATDVVLIKNVAKITKNKIKLDVVIKGRKAENISITSSSSQAYSVYKIALDAFTNCDSMLKMIIDNNRLNLLKNKNFVELKFEPAVQLKIAYGGGKILSVSKIVVPLSDKQTAPEWNFYYFGESQDWFALRWTKPDTKILKLLKQASQKLVES